MGISIIVACDENNLIGDDNKLPWHLPADLKYFKQVTLGKPIIMGRNTYESIGKPLPGRTNIIVTRQIDYPQGDYFVAHDVDQALDAAGDVDEVMIIGGAKIYTEFLPMANTLYMTKVKAEFSGDTHFPQLNPEQWQEISRQDHKADVNNEFDFSFIVLERID